MTWPSACLSDISLDEAATETEHEIHLVLEKGQAAPYPGVLVPELHYRDMAAELFKADHEGERFDQCSRELRELQADTELPRWQVGLAGVSFGILMTLAVHAYRK